MSHSLTVTEKEHWKNRIENRIDKRIDILCAKNPSFMEQIKEAAHERALESLGIGILQKRAKRFKKQISLLEDKRARTDREICAKLRGIPLGQVQCGCYGIQSEISQAVEKRQTVHEDELLAESERGREILSLQVEKENLLDTVWLATSTKQIKDLWTKVGEMLGDDQTKFQREALAITPVQEE